MATEYMQANILLYGAPSEPEMLEVIGVSTSASQSTFDEG